MACCEQGYEDDRFEIAVSQTFHCPICMNVFKDPVMCQRNQHCFCRSCITRHLRNSQTCPTCKEELTVETLTQAPRVYRDYLSELNIRCEYFNRGCREFVQLGNLEIHVKNCGFSPVLCSNQGCLVEINKQDRTHHETEICEFRKVKCHDCVEVRKEIGELKMNLKSVLDEMEAMSAEEKRDQIRNIQVMQDELKRDLNTMSDKLNQMNDRLDQQATLSEQIRNIQVMQEKMMRKVEESSTHATKTEFNGSVVVVGGVGKNSVERLSWSERCWTVLQSMKEKCGGASSVVYNNTMIVTGGWSISPGATDDIITMNINPVGDDQKWCDFPAKLPRKVWGHSCVVYNERLIVIGGSCGCVFSNNIHEILLGPPYTSNLLTRMPEERSFHGAQLFNDKILICGGTKTHCTVDSVIMYDISKNECKQMTPLPYAVSEMTTVSWGDNVIVIGGADKDCKPLNTVVIYNVKTGKSHVLPAMKCNRKGCVAVVVGNSIVVMGGKDWRGNSLKSVESFSFDRYSWEDLPLMNEARWLATVVAW